MAYKTLAYGTRVQAWNLGLRTCLASVGIAPVAGWVFGSWSHHLRGAPGGPSTKIVWEMVTCAWGERSGCWVHSIGAALNHIGGCKHIYQKRRTIEMSSEAPYGELPGFFTVPILPKGSFSHLSFCLPRRTWGKGLLLSVFASNGERFWG